MLVPAGTGRAWFYGESVAVLFDAAILDAALLDTALLETVITW
jgi:hypothetical protein